MSSPARVDQMPIVGVWDKVDDFGEDSEIFGRCAQPRYVRARDPHLPRARAVAARDMEDH